MGRKYKRMVGARHYKNYSEDTLRQALRRVTSRSMSLQEASATFGIPIRTLWNKVHRRHPNKPGGTTCLTEVEERHIVDVLIASAEFGSPLTTLEVRLIVKRYLDKIGRTITKFPNNTPGRDWVLNFLDRHSDRLTQRSCQNIKGARAEKSEEEINSYFNNLEISLQSVPDENVLNYDETNLSDDPGNKKCVFRRGTKYPERVMNSSKSSISVMFAVAGNGELLPPYVVYKAERIYDQWVIGGPPRTRYNRSKSGWFDAFCFEDWFETIALPWAQKKQGPKAIIGDNLSCHLNVNIIIACQRNNIRFVFLPPQSTHLTQPLDVGYYAPLKKYWRKILTDYKMKNPREKVLQKTSFPGLLKLLVDQLQLTDAKNIKSAFKATGIIPLDRNEVLKKLPNQRAEEKQVMAAVSETLLDYLKDTRAPASTPTVTRRKKMIQVEPGKSVANRDLNDAEQPSTSSEPHPNRSDDIYNLDELDDQPSPQEETIENYDNQSSEEDNEPLVSFTDQKQMERGDFVLVVFKTKRGERYYMGIIEEIDSDDLTVKFMRKKKNGFIFPCIDDISLVPRTDVVKKLVATSVSRGYYHFNVDFKKYYCP